MIIKMGRLFGTDGIRGVVNEDLDCKTAFKVGQAAAAVLTEQKRHRPVFLIGKDTRISSDMLEAALTAGLCSVGADVVSLGVIPTPAVAYLTVVEKADAGIVISASHNPYEHNGIKIFNAEGFKLSDELEEKIENLVLDGEIEEKTHQQIGRVLPCSGCKEKYVEHVALTVKKDLSSLRILVDCANGASSTTAPALFDRLGVRADFLFCEPDGVNINAGCGSTHLDTLGSRVAEGGYDAGIAFDGDADRCLMVDENGRVIDGDKILAVCGRSLLQAGRLAGNTIVATVMSNLGFHVFAKENGINVLQADVGDRNVLAEMLAGGYILGGEQSGHVIFLEHCTTGDGQLTAVQMLEILAASGGKTSALISAIPQFPQILKNIAVKTNLKDRIASDPMVKKAVSEAQQTLGGEGRVLVRPSGTEPLVRVMIEGKQSIEISALADMIAQSIQQISEK